MTQYYCSNCHRPYPDKGLLYKCPQCGGTYALNGTLAYDPLQIESELPGLWRYRHSFGLPADAPVLSMGEGGTPLLPSELAGKRVAFKLEFLNPTGSFKDRGTAPTLSFLRARGVTEAVEDSSGNAGASFAAYAARAGIQGHVFVPDYASGPKRAQIEAHGAEVVRILGPRSEAGKAVREAAEHGAVYASHSMLPFGLAGLATIAYELVEELVGAPGSVIAPVGHGSLLLGIAEGFRALRAAGAVATLPRLVGVQARACAPLWAVANMGAAGLAWMTEGETLAEGVRVKQPVRGDALMRAIQESGGAVLAVEEEEILPGRDKLAAMGLFVEPTSAIVWSALEQVAAQLPEPIVVVLTGSGLKAI
jgi:threonine synthase